VLGRQARTSSDPTLYGASAEQLLSVLRCLDDHVTTVVLIGHNPGVADLVDLLAAHPTTGSAAIDAFPTAAVAVLSVAGPWSATRPSCASLESFWSPRTK
jgi:phosphohistidine phosphatase